jgi:hypothetical protein
MKKRKLSTAAEIAEAKRIFLERQPLRVLSRAADAVRAGQAISPSERAYVSRRLDALYLLEFAMVRKSPPTAQLAEYLARTLKITRREAASYVVRQGREIPAVLRAITRLRQPRKKRRTRI